MSDNKIGPGAGHTEADDNTTHFVSTIVPHDDAGLEIGDYALEYARAGWEIFPLRGKFPLIPKHKGGKGVLDATSDVDRVA